MPTTIKNKPLLPKLRFPEFRGDGAWENIDLGMLCSVTTGKLDANAMVPDGEYRFYTCAKDHYYIDNYAFDTDALLVSGNGANVGYVHHYCGKFNAYQRTYVLDQFTENIAYLKCFLDRYLSKRIALEKMDGNTPYIVKSTLSEMSILIPEPEEQQKIAECLGSLDELIAAHSSKRAALQDHKKGLLQQLFPQRSENLEPERSGDSRRQLSSEKHYVPALRFPEFQNAGDWVEKELGSLAKFSSGGTPSKNEPSYWNGSIPWISASSMHSYFAEDSQLRVTEKAIGNGTRIAKKGSLLILVRGSMLFKRVPICLVLKDVAFNQDVKSLDLKLNINRRFILYQLVAFESRIPINRTGIGAGKIDTEDLKSFELFIPSPQEQQKIADCLSSLDSLITAQTEQIESLKTHKKGLMQQLFPNPED